MPKQTRNFSPGSPLLMISTRHLLVASPSSEFGDYYSQKRVVYSVNTIYYFLNTIYEKLVGVAYFRKLMYMKYQFKRWSIVAVCSGTDACPLGGFLGRATFGGICHQCQNSKPALEQPNPMLINAQFTQKSTKGCSGKVRRADAIVFQSLKNTAMFLQDLHNKL